MYEITKTSGSSLYVMNKTGGCLGNAASKTEAAKLILNMFPDEWSIDDTADAYGIIKKQLRVDVRDFGLSYARHVSDDDILMWNLPALLSIYGCYYIKGSQYNSGIRKTNEE